jgi:hypothetical protein
MLSPHVYEMPFQSQPHGVGQHDATILLSFSPPHRDLAPLEIQILDAQREALLESEARPVEHRSHELRNTR